uniref:Uncharacterized protein n=1 Tax=Arion vulgaris TaxID=1028688 RepID=A0A0B6YHX1_9EUPU
MHADGSSHSLVKYITHSVPEVLSLTHSAMDFKFGINVSFCMFSFNRSRYTTIELQYIPLIHL